MLSKFESLSYSSKTIAYYLNDDSLYMVREAIARAAYPVI